MLVADSQINSNPATGGWPGPVLHTKRVAHISLLRCGFTPITYTLLRLFGIAENYTPPAHNGIERPLSLPSRRWRNSNGFTVAINVPNTHQKPIKTRPNSSIIPIKYVIFNMLNSNSTYPPPLRADLPKIRPWKGENRDPSPRSNQLQKIRLVGNRLVAEGAHNLCGECARPRRIWTYGL